MSRKWLSFVAVILAAAVIWNEYRLWTRGQTGTVLQVVQWAPEEPAVIAPATNIAGDEESEPTVIDLSWLQRQTTEPPMADTEEPTTLPVIPEPPHDSVPMPKTSPSVPQFEPHSADGS